MGIVYVKSSLSTTAPNGLIYKLTVGEAWDADDPLVKARPQLFDALPSRTRTSSGWVETATANPGEKRSRKR